MDEACDGLGGEVDGGDAFEDDPRNLAAPDGDEDDLARLEFLVGGIGEGAAVGAIDFCGHDLEKHGFIVAF